MAADENGRERVRLCVRFWVLALFHFGRQPGRSLALSRRERTPATQDNFGDVTIKSSASFQEKDRGASPPGFAEQKRRLSEARRLRRADALAASGQADKAVSVLKRLVRDQPGSTRACLRLASLLRDARRSDEALLTLRHAVASSPHSLPFREALAELCLEMGRVSDAITEGRALLQIAPRSLLARDVLSAAYLQSGELARALRVAEEMIALDPFDGSNHFKRGVLLQQMGRVGPALAAFLRALDLEDSDSEVADECRSAVEMLDGWQMRQIVQLAVENIPFRLHLRRDPATALTEKGYLLSERGLYAVSQLSFDDLAVVPPGWRHYHYH